MAAVAGMAVLAAGMEGPAIGAALAGTAVVRVGITLALAGMGVVVPGTAVTGMVAATGIMAVTAAVGELAPRLVWVLALDCLGERSRPLPIMVATTIAMTTDLTPVHPRKEGNSRRANLQPRSRSASVIDRLLKNQNPSENRNNLRSSSPHPGPGQTSGEPRRNFAVRNSSTRKPWLFRSPVFGSGIRRLDGEAVGGRRLARTPPNASRAGWRLRQSHHRLQHPLQRGMNSRPPSRYFRLQNRGAVIQAVPAASYIQNNPRVFMFLNGFCPYGDRITTNCGPRS
jgi:hypothetical protein